MSEYSLRERCGLIGAFVFRVYRFGNKTVYGSHWKPVRKFRMMLYQALDLVVVRLIASARIPAQIRIGERIGLVHDALGVVIHPHVVIGDDCTIYHQVTIGHVWGKPGSPTIGNGVLIGAGAKVLGPVTIGDYAAVGAGAVVTKDVPEGATAIGSPARVIEPAPGWERRPRY